MRHLAAMILLKKAAQVACVSNYVMLKIPCVDSVPVADICSRVKYVACQGSFKVKVPLPGCDAGPILPTEPL